MLILVPTTLREPIQDVVLPLSAPIQLSNGQTVDALTLPKGTPCVLPIVAINCKSSAVLQAIMLMRVTAMDEIWGEDAEAFRPSRWLSDLPDSVDKATHGYTLYSHLLTFLSGPRGCIG